MADDGGMSRTAPLFRFDPGWLFTLAGLVVMVASALLPAERDLHELRQQLAALEFREAYNTQRLQAYDRFMKELAARDPALLRRLAASQLNLMPDDVEPLLMATSIESTVSDWIEATVPLESFQPTPPPDTLLTRLAEGPRRLWLMGGGAAVVFLGLVMGFSVSPRPTLVVQASDVESWREAVEAEVAAEAAAQERADDAAIETDASASVALADDIFEELPVETGDVDSPNATAEPLEQETFDWPQVQPPFELAGSETGATVDGASIASAWQDTVELDQVDAEDAWLRAHGTD